MFSPKEISYLKKELGAYIEKAQQRLDQSGVEGKQRERIENKLITSVSIVNKLTHIQPDEDKKSPDVNV